MDSHHAEADVAKGAGNENPSTSPNPIDAVRAAIERDRQNPPEAFARAMAQAPRTEVDITRMEICTGMVWLADGSRLSFKLGLPPVVQRVEGIKDPSNGLPIYELPWQLQCVVKPKR